MRTRSILGTGLVALIASGCGDDDSGRGAAGEQGARAALVQFSDAFVDKRYDAACAVFSERAKRLFDREQHCADALKLGRGSAKDAELKVLRDKAHTVKITVDGDKATVDSVTADPKNKSRLVRDGGRWFIDE